MEEEKINKTEEVKSPTDLEAHEASDMIAKANEAAERLEAANREQARLLQKQEQLKVNSVLGGKSNVTEPKKEEESPQDYAKRVLKNEL